MSAMPSQAMWQGNHQQEMARPEESEQFPSSALLLTGLAVVAVGALAWYYLGPDLVRYMKIREM